MSDSKYGLENMHFSSLKTKLESAVGFFFIALNFLLSPAVFSHTTYIIKTLQILKKPF